MPPKALAHRRTKKTNTAYGRELRSLVEDHRVLTKRLLDLIELLEDEDDHRKIEAARKRNGTKPGVPWSEAKKRLGLTD